MSQPVEDLDDLIEAVTVDCYGEDEELGAFLQAFGEELTLPAEASVVGVPVELIAIEHGGHVRCGLIARCRRHGQDYDVAAADVVLPRGSKASTLLAAYHHWLGCDPETVVDDG
jgi:hypothetical protein